MEIGLWIRRKFSSTSLRLVYLCPNYGILKVDVSCKMKDFMLASSSCHHNCMRGLIDYSDTQRSYGLNVAITAVVEATITVPPINQLTLLLAYLLRISPSLPTVGSHTPFYSSRCTLFPAFLIFLLFTHTHTYIFRHEYSHKVNHRHISNHTHTHTSF